jgi:hypothetical protein
MHKALYATNMRQKCGVGLRPGMCTPKRSCILILTAETRDGAGQCDQLRSCLQAQTCTFNIVPVRHRGEPPGHTGDRTHTGHTRAHKGTRTTQTNITTSQTHQHTTRTSARRPKPRSVPVLRRYVFRTFVREQSSILSSQ